MSLSLIAKVEMECKAENTNSKVRKNKDFVIGEWMKLNFKIYLPYTCPFANS